MYCSGNFVLDRQKRMKVDITVKTYLFFPASIFADHQRDIRQIED